MKAYDRTGGSPPTARRGREARAAKYRRAKGQALASFRQQRLEESLLYAQAAATYAWLNHFGLWYDDELEKLLSSAGSAVCRRVPDRPLPRRRADRVFLYVATALDGIGGHGEVLRLWLKLLSGDQNLTQYVATTLRAAPAFLAKARAAGGVRLSVDGVTLTERIESLVRRGLEIQPDRIFLFANPDDVVAISAVGVLKARLGARVIFCDHAGFVFWLGKNLPDVLVALAPSLACVPRTLRGYRGCVKVVPLTTDLAEGSPPAYARAEAQRSTVSLSIGSPWKVVSDSFWDYFGAIRRILERNPIHTHTLLTLPDRSITEALRPWPEDVRARLDLQYGVTQLAPYYRRADFLIETFPFSGGQVRTEAMAFGLPVVFMQNVRFPLALAHAGIDSAAPSYPFIARSNEDVIGQAEVLIRNPAARQKYGECLRAMFLRDSSPDLIRSKLERVAADGGPCAWPERSSDTLETITLDDDYLMSSALGRDRPSSPFMLVLREAMRSDTLRCRVLIDCVRNLTPDDWWWSVRHLGRRWPRVMS